MTGQGDLAAILADIELDYSAVQALQMRWEALQTVEQAYKEYQARISEEEVRLNLPALRAQKARLEQDDALLTLPERSPEVIDPPVWRAGRDWTGPSRRTTADPPTELRPEPPEEGAVLEARRGLKRAIPSLARAWQLDRTVQGKINRIVDDAGAPLGEALALLPWAAFRERVRARESDEEYRKRLVEWGAALEEYRAWLNRRIDDVKFTYRDFLEIWQLWRERDVDGAGEERWHEFMQATLESSRQEAGELSAAIAEKRAGARDGKR